MDLRYRALVAWLGLFTPVVSSAVIDFEGVSHGLHSTLAIVDGGVTAVFSNAAPDLLHVQDLSLYFGPASWGSASLWTGGIFSSTSPTTVNFSHGLNWVSVEFGDYGQDDDELFLWAFSDVDGTGTMLGSAGASYSSWKSLDLGDVVTLSVTSVTPIRSVLLGSFGYAGLNNIYIDNLRFERSDVPVVPGPVAAVPFVVGLMARRMRRRI
ncbi:MAG: hypothetical protein N2109_01355 [Fimbriimonadales bacterium]|nr:hypothetical protein [Fimbriimonadales bacterium]